MRASSSAAENRSKHHRNCHNSKREEVSSVAKATKPSGIQPRKRRAALTPEARENQLIDLAVNLIEKRLLEGTASSQEVTTILKLGTTRARLENERLAKEVELVQAKTEAYKSGVRMDELYEKAMAAFKRYSGQDEEDGDEYYMLLGIDPSPHLRGALPLSSFERCCRRGDLRL